MLRQGHDSAPGLDIMLLKQQYLSVSGQAANPARQHPPQAVEYLYHSSHPMLHFLPLKLAEWIANNYSEELNVPPRPDPSKRSTATLNRILQTCLVSDSRGINIHTFQTVEFESDLYHRVMRARCYPFNMERRRNAKVCTYYDIHGICIVYYMYMLEIFFVYTYAELFVLTAGLFGNYPSSSIIHWRVWRRI